MKLLTMHTEDRSNRRNATKKKEPEAAEKRIAKPSAIFKYLQGRVARHLKPYLSDSQPDRERQNFLHFFYFFYLTRAK